LLFHYLILLQAKGFKLIDVVEVLKKRDAKWRITAFNRWNMHFIGYIFFLAKKEKKILPFYVFL
jgi:hypothetical protein